VSVVTDDSDGEPVFVNGLTDIFNQIGSASVNEQSDGGGISAVAGQVINVEPSQGLLPFSVLPGDVFGTTADGDIAVQVLRGLECGGIQLQLAGSAAASGGIQIAGLDGSSLISQAAVQIDAAMLQQLQQGGVNLCIDPKLLSFNTSALTVEGSVVHDQMQDMVMGGSASTNEIVNPNVVMQTSVSSTPPALSTNVQQTPMLINATSVIDGIDNAVVGGGLLEQMHDQHHAQEQTVIRMFADGQQTLESVSSSTAAVGLVTDDGEDIVGHQQMLNGEVCFIQVQPSGTSSNTGSAVERSDLKRTHTCMVCFEFVTSTFHMRSFACMLAYFIHLLSSVSTLFISQRVFAAVRSKMTAT
jgi:hypothetical protein